MADEDWEEVITGDSEMWDKKSILIGVLTKKQENVGPNESMLYNIKTDDGKDIGVWGSTVLDNKFAEVPIGFKVKIEPIGMVMSPKTKREYMDYRIMMKPFEGWEAGKEPTPTKAPKKEDVVIEDIGDEPINLADIPF